MHNKTHFCLSVENLNYCEVFVDNKDDIWAWKNANTADIVSGEKFNQNFSNCRRM